MKPIQLVNEFGQDKLNNAEHSDFHASILQYLQQNSAGSFNCTDAELKEYEAAQQAEENLLGRQSASVLTADIEQTDEERDGILSYFFSQVDTAAKCPMPAQKNAGVDLQILIKPFRGVGRIALSQESTEVRSLIEKLKQQPQQIAAVPGLSDTITALEQANDKVVQLMSQRTGSEEAKAETLKHRAVTEDCYEYIIQKVNSTLVLHSNPQVEQIKKEINNLIDRTNNVYNQRMGVKHANDAKKEQNEQE